MENNDDKRINTMDDIILLKLEDEKEISERIKFTWEQYNRLANLLMTLSTGTLGVFGSIFIISNKYIEISNLTIIQKYFASLGLISITVSLVCVVFWRSLSQIGMEKEVLGDRKKVKAYLDSTGMIVPFTSFYKDINEKRTIGLWKLMHTLSLVFFIIGWALNLMFFISLLF